MKYTVDEWAALYAMKLGSFYSNQWKAGERAFMQEMADDAFCGNMDQAANEIVLRLGYIDSKEVYYPPPAKIR